MLSPKTRLKRSGGTPFFLNTDNVATGSTAEIRAPYRYASAAVSLVMSPISPSQINTPPVMNVATSVPTIDNSMIALKLEKNP